MQDVKHFIQGRDVIAQEYNEVPLEDQINSFLKEHPTYSVSSLSTLIGPAYKEAFVVFNVREERKDFKGKPEYSNNPGANNKNKSNAVTAQNH